jgi:hypothetical protein
MIAQPLSTVLSGFLPDCRRYSVPVAVVRVLRGSRLLGMTDLHAALAAQPAFQRHVALKGPQDGAFFLSYKHFLAQGLGGRTRAEAALAHYRHESEAFVPAYLDAVYEPEGLTLWAAEVEGVRYDMRLMLGHDVLHEGSLSVVFHVDGGRVCVLSFATMPGRLLGLGEEAPLVPFVVRKHLAQDHSYQTAFHKAFDRVTAAHLTFGAMSGIALAQGMPELVGVTAERQVSFRPARSEEFARAYTEFWESVGGRKVSDLAWRIPAQMELSPLEEMNARQRKRARTRRAHIEAVQAQSEATLRAYLKG